MDTPQSDSAIAPAPVADSDRLIAIDATRGLALLGILLVNVQSFGEAFGRFLRPRPESSDWATTVCFYLVKIFCEGKFYPLFSLLFGMGLILQMESLARKSPERSFKALYARRLLVLLAIGAIHALALWYGDILFIYAIAGTVLLICARLKARTLMTVGIALVLFSTVLSGVVGAVLRPGQQPPPPAAAAAETKRVPDGLDEMAAKSSFFELMRALRDEEIQGGPEQQKWIDLEERAYRDGPYTDLFLFRAMSWVLYLVFCMLGFGWHVIGMFFIGAALLKMGIFSPERRALRVKLAVAGAAIGVPGAIFSTVIFHDKPGVAAGAAGMAIPLVAGPLMSLMYLSVVSFAAERACAAIRTLAAVGRMALTNYLMHSLICTTIFYFYGFGQFAEWTRPQRVMLATAIFALQCILSPLWLRAFRLGPMEWLWRSLTYLKVQRMRRSSIATRA